MKKSAEILLMPLNSAARIYRANQRLAEQDLAEGNPPGYETTRSVAALQAAIQVETLTSVIRELIRRCPEVGLTDELLHTALNSDLASALFLEDPL